MPPCFLLSVFLRTLFQFGLSHCSNDFKLGLLFRLPNSGLPNQTSSTMTPFMPEIPFLRTCQHITHMCFRSVCHHLEAISHYYFYTLAFAILSKRHSLPHHLYKSLSPFPSRPSLTLLNTL